MKRSREKYTRFYLISDEVYKVRVKRNIEYYTKLALKAEKRALKNNLTRAKT